MSDPAVHDAPGMSAQVRCDPQIKGGVPCLAGTRVPTAGIWSFWQAGVPVSIIANEYGLSQDQVWAAICFEDRRHAVHVRSRRR